MLYTRMLTCEFVGGVHAPLSTVQRNTFVPCERPETVVVALFALAKTPVPLTTVHVPTAGGTAVFAARVVLTVGRHKDCEGPALAAGWFGS